MQGLVSRNPHLYLGERDIEDLRCVWFMPKVAPPKHWLAKILVEVLVANDLANIGKKNELELARVHWHAK